MTDKPQRKPFTGWHMTAILIAFFGVIIAVNFTMARLAMSTFGGKVVENSYVASQHYNEWLQRAAVQDRLGWMHDVSVDGDRHVRVLMRKDGKPLDGLHATAEISHPLGRTVPATLRFEGVSDGVLRSVEPLAVGRWRLDLRVARGPDEARYRVELR